MLNDSVLINDWHVIARSTDVVEGKPLRARLLAEDLVIWRTGSRIMVWQDLCIHRGTRLSLGSIQTDTLMCPYHGWTYNADGQCVKCLPILSRCHPLVPVSKPTAPSNGTVGFG